MHAGTQRPIALVGFVDDSFRQKFGQVSPSSLQRATTVCRKIGLRPTEKRSRIGGVGLQDRARAVLCKILGHEPSHMGGNTDCCSTTQAHLGMVEDFAGSSERLKLLLHVGYIGTKWLQMDDWTRTTSKRRRLTTYYLHGLRIQNTTINESYTIHVP